MKIQLSTRPPRGSTLAYLPEPINLDSQDAPYIPLAGDRIEIGGRHFEIKSRDFSYKNGALIITLATE
jgi:hypothetical protein